MDKATTAYGHGYSLWTWLQPMDKATTAYGHGYYGLWTWQQPMDKAMACGQGSGLWTRLQRIDTSTAHGEGNGLWTRLQPMNMWPGSICITSCACVMPCDMTFCMCKTDLSSESCCFRSTSLPTNNSTCENPRRAIMILKCCSLVEKASFCLCSVDLFTSWGLGPLPDTAVRSHTATWGLYPIQCTCLWWKFSLAKNTHYTVSSYKISPDLISPSTRVQIME